MKNLINKLKEKWSIPQKANHRGEETFFRFVCLFNDGAIDIDSKIPIDIRSFLLESNGAELFKDVDYGQWGLRIISYDDLQQFNVYTREWRGSDLIENDLVIGEFLGDLDLLLVSLDKSNYGNVIICTPIDKRENWYFLKITFKEFLEKYIKNEGDKFWENL